MKFLGMGGFEFVIILIVILLIFGPKNLPKLGNALGKTLSNLRSGMNEGKKKKADDVEETPADEEPTVVAEIEGEVEDVLDASEQPEEEAADEAEDAPEVAFEDVPEEVEAPKKVRRVVKKTS